MGCSSINERPEISFRCIYDIKNYNENQIINDRCYVNNREVINEEIKSKIKILNGNQKNQKEELILKKKFDKQGYNSIDFMIKEKLTDMSFIFFNCDSLKKIEFISFDTSLVNNMQYMFAGCKEIEYLDLSYFNTSNVKNISYMFSNCNILKEIKGINNFNTSNVTNMKYMFSGCNTLENLD